MASNLYIPFNFAPSSVAVKTGSYTIPAGKYARVIVEVDSGGIFTINAVNAVTSAAFANIDVGSGSSPTSYSVPTGFKASATLSCSSGSGTITLNGNSTEVTPVNTYSSEFSIGPGGSYSITGTNGHLHIQGVATPSNATNRQADLWVPTGTIINGSGNWRAVVMEYNEIT